MVSPSAFITVLFFPLPRPPLFFLLFGFFPSSCALEKKRTYRIRSIYRRFASLNRKRCAKFINFKKRFESNALLCNAGQNTQAQNDRYQKNGRRCQTKIDRFQKKTDRRQTEINQTKTDRFQKKTDRRQTEINRPQKLRHNCHRLVSTSVVDVLALNTRRTHTKTRECLECL